MKKKEKIRKRMIDLLLVSPLLPYASFLINFWFEARNGAAKSLEFNRELYE